MNVNPGNAPPGWKAEWSQQYARHFYINLSTNESTWSLPTASFPPVHRQQSLQRKPVPDQYPPMKVQTSTAVKQETCIEAYPTPPPQVTTSYFPPIPTTQQSPQTQYSQVPLTQQQQTLHAPSPQYMPLQIQYQASPQQFSLTKTHGQSPASFQQQSTSQLQSQYPQQQRNLSTSDARPSGNILPQYPQQAMQTLSPPATPSGQVYQRATHVAIPQQQPHIYALTGTKSAGHFVPQQHGTFTSYPQQSNNFAQPQQQVANVAQPSSHYGQQALHPNHNQVQTQQQQQQGKFSPMTGGNMMNKMSSKFTQLQKGVTGPPTAAHPNGKPADWKKWGKRAAIGVAGIGALALGVDSAGDMFSGAEGFSGGDWSGGGGEFSGGGGDFSGFEGSGDAAGVMDAQTMLDANNAQLEMAGIGQENASMLLDPVGTEYTWIGSAEATQNAASLI